MKQNKVRRQLEILASGVILLSALGVIFYQQPIKKTIKLDNEELVYKGTLRHDRLNGQGELSYANGDSYQGEFKNGSFHGKGVFTSHKGWTYEGDFERGQAHGQGMLRTEDGRVFQGTFKQGIYQK